MVEKKLLNQIANENCFYLEHSSLMEHDLL